MSAADDGILDDEALGQALTDLPGWEQDDDAIVTSYSFDDFGAAIDFMSTAAPRIDELDHHPEWTNVYATVDVRLSSHDVGGVTERDLRLARVLDGIAGR